MATIAVVPERRMTPEQAREVLPELVKLSERLSRLVADVASTVNEAQALTSELGARISRFVDECPGAVGSLYDSARHAEFLANDLLPSIDVRHLAEDAEEFARVFAAVAEIQAERLAEDEEGAR